MAAKWNGIRNFTENRASMCGRARSRPSPKTGDSDTNVIAGAGGQWANQRNTLLPGPHPQRRAGLGGNCCGASSVASETHHEVSPRFALRAGARVSRDEDIEDGTLPDPQVRGRRAGLRMALAAQLSR